MHLSLTIPLYISDPLHLEFTHKTIDSIRTRHDYHITLVVNHCSSQFESELKKLVACNLSLVSNPQGNTLAAAWNLGIQQAFGLSATSYKQPATSIHTRPAACSLSPVADFCLVINNDILFHPQAIDHLITFAADHPEFLLWTATEWSDARTLDSATWDGSFSLHPHFSCFMVNRRTIDTVGWFDENLKGAYFEDNDYHIRILLSGHQAAATTTAKFYHYGSRTANIDTDLKYSIKHSYLKNRAYIKKKWGIDLHGHPGFSPPDKILKEIYQTPSNDSHQSIKDW